MLTTWILWTVCVNQTWLNGALQFPPKWTVCGLKHGRNVDMSVPNNVDHNEWTHEIKCSSQWHVIYILFKFSMQINHANSFDIGPKCSSLELNMGINPPLHSIFLTQFQDESVWLALNSSLCVVGRKMSSGGVWCTRKYSNRIKYKSLSMIW